MSVRNLGDWSPLGRGGDPVHADLDKVQEAGVHYRKVATTLDDAVARLDKIVSGTDGLKGEYADQVRDDARSVRDSLQKAGVRYGDVADQIGIYLPELTTALSETKTALEEATTAKAGLTTATGMPEGVPGEDGQLPEEERAKDDARSKAVTAAEDAIAQARRRMDNALGALDVAGKRFGDAVNCKRYDDGLSDTWKDKLLWFFDKISKALTIIAMVLGILCLIFPGIAALVALAAVVAVVSLAVTATLYAEGKEGLPDLLFSILGVVTLGIGTVVSLGGKLIAVGFRGFFANAASALRFRPGTMLGAGRPPSPGIELGPIGSVLRPPVGRPAGWVNQSDWFNNPLTNWLMGKSHWGRMLMPEVGFWTSSKQQLFAAGKLWETILKNPRAGFTEWAGVVGGWSGYRAAAFALPLNTLSPLWAAWGGVSTFLTLVTGLAWAGGRYTEVIPVYGAREGE